MEKRIQRSSCRSRQTQRRRSTARPYLRGLRWNPGACWDREDSSLDYSAGLSRVIKSFPLRRGFAERCAPECEKRSRDVIRARSIRAAAIVRNRDSRYARRRRSINYPDVTVGRAAGRGEGGRGGVGGCTYVRHVNRTPTIAQRFAAESVATHFTFRGARLRGYVRDTARDTRIGGWARGSRVRRGRDSKYKITKIYSWRPSTIGPPCRAGLFIARMAFTI